ncbi:hypothetical protein BJ170DRAFT_731926 [Xylariales sp. AK1849]|nr:hypothetical protein BJ170DRAFT_731926 [Xylariales sp. AK1849]
MSNMDSKPPLNHTASQETLVSLLQLDPTPMDTASLYEKELPPLPEEDRDIESSTATLRSQPTSSSTNSGSTLGLSGSGGGSVYYLTRIQRYSSYTFTFFAGLHITNTSLLPLLYNSVPYSEPFLLSAREIYQTRLSEPLLVGLPIIAHVASGIALRLIRRSQNLKRYGGGTPGMYGLTSTRGRDVSRSSTSSKGNGSRIWPVMSYVSISGYAFILPLAAHVFINRALPLLVEGDSSNIGLAYVAHGFARHGVQPWIAYALLLSLGVGHMVWGWAKWMGAAPPVGWWKSTMDKELRKRRRRTWWGINIVVVAIAGVWAAGGLGVVARSGKAEGWLGSVYDGIYNWAGQ